jgi:TRAP-type mannitol/chloroaromatic compound transport system permease small subunit
MGTYRNCLILAPSFAGHLFVVSYHKNAGSQDLQWYVFPYNFVYLAHGQTVKQREHIFI